ncbi:MAG: hypothetical protein ACRDRS_24245 [Pseudonocardiaceae bacterium]
MQLIDRTEQLGLIARNRDEDADRRIVRLTLTEAGEEKLSLLSAIHLEELARLTSLVTEVVDPVAAARQAL